MRGSAIARRAGIRPSKYGSKATETFASVWDAIANTAEEGANLRVRSDLMSKLAAIVEKNGWTQTQAANRCGVTQPRINELLRGRLSRFSLDALVNIAAALGQRVHVELVVASGVGAARGSQKEKATASQAPRERSVPRRGRKVASRVATAPVPTKGKAPTRREDPAPGIFSPRWRPLCPLISEEHHACRREPSRLELLCELRHDVPPPLRNGPLDGPHESVLDGRFLWPKRDQLTRTYGSSRNGRALGPSVQFTVGPKTA
jgi:predicted XRE-type DNA-binding protein